MTTLDKKRNNIKSKEASFLSKLYKILEDPLFSNCVRWSPDGLSFIIINQKLFEKKALPKYFAHHKFASFHRQLNLYNFRKVKTKNGEHKYEHEEFNKWKTIEEIKLIKKKFKNKKEKEKENDNITNSNIKTILIENKIEENKKLENNIDKNKIIENDIILKFENLDENSKIDICENIIKKGELSKNENKLLLIYLLDKNKENIETIKSLQNEIKILNDKNNVLMGQLRQFGVSYYYLQNKNDKIKPDIQSLNINVSEEFPQIINKDKERRNDFTYINNYNNNYNKNFFRNYNSNYYNDYISNYNNNYNCYYNTNYMINPNNSDNINDNNLKRVISNSNNINNGINYYYNYKI